MAIQFIWKWYESKGWDAIGWDRLSGTGSGNIGNLWYLGNFGNLDCLRIIWVQRIVVIKVIWEILVIWVICPDRESVKQGNLGNLGNLGHLKIIWVQGLRSFSWSGKFW